jgi:hypothetical protein
VSVKKYYKNIAGGYITVIGTGIGDVEIAQEEYEHILSVVRSCPTAEPGYMYKLKTDLTWEQVEAPPEDIDPEISDKEAMDIILGGAAE